jgi:hypothetical protein
MRKMTRFLLPLVQVALAVVLTIPEYFRPESSEHPLKEKLNLQLGFALNAPAATLRYFLERFAMLFCPERYMTGTFTGCFPLQFVFETIVYFGLVALLWHFVILESGRQESVITSKTRMRKVVDALGILFGALVGAFGVMISHQIGSPINSFVVGIMYVIWSLTIMVFYGRDFWLHFRLDAKAT